MIKSSYNATTTIMVFSCRKKLFDVKYTLWSGLLRGVCHIPESHCKSIFVVHIVLLKSSPYQKDQNVLLCDNYIGWPWGGYKNPPKKSHPILLLFI